MSAHASAEALFREDPRHLAELASRAVAKGYSDRTALLVLIDVDSGWRGLADLLMPGEEQAQRWAAMRAEGLRPVARGYVLREGAEAMFRHLVPAIARGLRSRLAPGQFRVVVCVEGGGVGLLHHPVRGAGMTKPVLRLVRPGYTDNGLGRDGLDPDERCPLSPPTAPSSSSTAGAAIPDPSTRAPSSSTGSSTAASRARR
jgi:hypothetical protein